MMDHRQDPLESRHSGGRGNNPFAFFGILAVSLVITVVVSLQAQGEGRVELTPVRQASLAIAYLNNLRQKDEARALADMTSKKIASEQFVKRGCSACHHPTNKTVGPAVTDLKGRYKPSDLDELVAKVKKGGSGVWGEIMMPPQGHVPEAEIKAIVAWFLTGQDVEIEVDKTVPQSAPIAHRAPHGGLLLSGNAGNKGKELMQKNGCLACHAEDTKLVGPSLVDIAKKYSGQPVTTTLVEKVVKGGSGVWGTMMMPPQGHVPKADIEVMVAWILDHKAGGDDSHPTPASREDIGSAPDLNVDLATHGQHVYANACTACHMKDGKGKPGLAPSIRNRDFLALASDHFIKDTIRDGRPGTSMPPHPQLSERDLDGVVTWLRAIDPKNPVAWDRKETYRARGQASRGEPLFMQYCSSCHGRKGEGYASGGSGPGIGLKGFLQAANDGYIYQTIKHGRVGTAMMPFDGARGLAHLDQQQIDDIIVYLRNSMGNK